MQGSVGARNERPTSRYLESGFLAWACWGCSDLGHIALYLVGFLGIHQCVQIGKVAPKLWRRRQKLWDFSFEQIVSYDSWDSEDIESRDLSVMSRGILSPGVLSLISRLSISRTKHRISKFQGFPIPARTYGLTRECAA